MEDKAIKKRKKKSFIFFLTLTVILELSVGIIMYILYSNSEKAQAVICMFFSEMIIIPAVIGILRGVVENTGERLLTDKKKVKGIIISLLKLIGTILMHSVLCQFIYETAYCAAYDTDIIFSIYESITIFRYAFGIGLAAFILTCVISLCVPKKVSDLPSL